MKSCFLLLLSSLHVNSRRRKMMAQLILTHHWEAAVYSLGNSFVGGSAVGKLTWQRAAQDLHPHADAPIIEPGLRVYSNVAGNHGDWQLIEHRNLLLTVPFKYLLTLKGKEGAFKDLHPQRKDSQQFIHSLESYQAVLMHAVNQGKKEEITPVPCPWKPCVLSLS